MSDRQPGYIDGRRTRVGGVPVWGAVPDVLIPGAMEAYGIFEDFYLITELAGGITIPGWLFDQTNSLLSIEDAEPGGIVNLANQVAAGDNDTAQITLGDGAGGAFVPAAGKDIWFEARVRTTKTGDNPNYFFGLQDPAGATELILDNGGNRVNNHLCFQILDTGAVAAPNWTFEGTQGAAVDTNDLLIAQDPGVFHTFGFHVVGVTRVDVYIDRVIIAAGQVDTAEIPVTGLMPVIFFKAGDASLESIGVDYIMCVQLR